MSFQRFLFVIIFAIGMIFAAPSPHIGMVHSQPGFASKPAFLFMNKKTPTCNPLYATLSILI